MSTFFHHYKILIIAALLVLIVAAWYITGTVMSVNRYVEQFNATYDVKDEQPGEQVNMYRVPGYHELLREKGLLSSHIQLAKNDSIGLFLNLSDSVAQLMIKGLAVRDIPLQKIEFPSVFKRTSQEALYEWLSVPVSAKTILATIDKEPLNVVQAPKDTNDFVPDVKPDTTNRETVFFILDSERDLRLYFYQIEKDDSEWKAALSFEWEDRWKQVKQNICSIFKFEVPVYVPTLRIGITKEDAKVLYRALPENGKIVITY